MSVDVALGNVVEVGVGDRFGPLGPERCIERLQSQRKATNNTYVRWSKTSQIGAIVTNRYGWNRRTL
jgi:hypothetical protein